MPKPITIRFPDSLVGELSQRIPATGNQHDDSLASAARDSLSRYFILLKDARRKLRRLFSPEECRAVVALLWSTVTWGDASWVSNRLIALELEDALEDGFAERHGIDGPALVKKLNALNPVENVALLDAVERCKKGLVQPETLLNEEAP